MPHPGFIALGMEQLSFLTDELLISSIKTIRNCKVLLDEDLAALYDVPTKRLNEQVKRNLERFPPDFMFQLTGQEMEILKSQFATSSWGGRRKLPYAFTEHGILMLSSVLGSPRAVQVNIRIMRVYVRLREMLLIHKDALLKLEHLEHQVLKHTDDIDVLFNALKQLLAVPEIPMEPIGFRIGLDKS